MFRPFAIIISFFVTTLCYSQKIENEKNLDFFVQKLKKNQSVTNILFLGDSHIQAGWLPNYLKDKFQNQFGNAGRGLVFPYSVANSNGPDDFTSASNQTWENFRLVYDQDIFPEMGAAGFVIGNHQNSFLEIKFKNPSDIFNKIIIFHDAKMEGSSFSIYQESASISLNSFIKKITKTQSYNVQNGETLPELASKFYTTTTKLKSLNGASIQNPIAGKEIKTESITISYNPDFEKNIQLEASYKFGKGITEISYLDPTQSFVVQSSAKNNTFYGFQFINDKKKNGVLFNTVGVNGATYQDFLKFPLQLDQLNSTKPDAAIISLGTNESLSDMTKEQFQQSVATLIDKLQKANPNIGILLVSPTINNLQPEKVSNIVNWISETAKNKNVAFLNQFENMGGKGYFKSALSRKEANTDGVHFLKPGYENQAEKIWQAINKLLNR